MKKSKIALGVIVALGVVWTGGAWFTGKQIESNIGEMVNRANQQLANQFPDSHLQLTQQDFRRGVFSSSVQLVLQGTADASQDDPLPAGQKVIFNETIDHGPLPLAQLKHANLIPAAASVHTEIEKNGTVEGLFSLSDGHSPLSADTRLGYDKSSQTQLNVRALQYSDDTGKLSTQPSEMTLYVDGEQNTIRFNADIGDLNASFSNDSHQPVTLALAGLNLSGDSQLSPEGLRLGRQTLNLKSLNTTVNGQPMLAVNGVALNSDFNNASGKTGGKINYTVNDLQMKQQSLGSAALNMTLSNFDTQSVKTFYDNYNSVVRQNLAQLASGQQTDPQVMQQAANSALLENIPLLLKGAPTLSVDSLTLKNAKGESHFSLKADFNDPTTVTTAPQSLAQVADGYMKDLNASLSINMPMAQQLLSVVGQSQGYQPQDADKLAEQQIKGLSAMGEMFHLSTVKDQDIVSTLQYQQGDVTVNGAKMPLEQFIQQYIPMMPSGDDNPQ